MGGSENFQFTDVWHGGLAYPQKQSPCAPGFDDSQLPLVPNAIWE